MLHAIVRKPLVPAPTTPILVLLHGYGSNEEDLMGLAPELDPRLCLVCPRAPRNAPNGGFAWFDLHWDHTGPHGNPDQALESRDILIDTLEELPGALGFESSSLLLGGFSQGAMLSVGVGLKKPGMATGIMSLSGRLIPEFQPRADETTSATRLPFLVQHGALDPVLPVSGSREMCTYLEERGFPVTYGEYTMAHEISQKSLADARQWLAERLQDIGHL